MQHTRQGHAELRVNRDVVRLPTPVPEHVSSVDVILSGHRVWSIDLVSDPAKREQLEHPWPAPLLPYLDGTAHVEIADSTTGSTLWTADVQLGTASEPIQVVDGLGRHVAMNKWGRLGKTFSGAEAEMRTRLLDRLDVLIVELQELGLKPFVVGGTLLGAVRSGEILPHDDDADIAYLSDFEHPGDIGLENGRLTDTLRERGYEIVKHSNTHLQITFRHDDGLVDNYIDIFTAFWTPDGQMNQPFHVRGPLERASMLPFSTVTLEGRNYPAPAVAEDWLVINYDENWRTPLPGYKLRTPRTTARRFQSWFGSYNFQRDFWEDAYVYGTHLDEPTDLRAADRVLATSDAGDTVIDLGCGAGAQAAHLAHQGRRVEAFDYSPAALARAALHDLTDATGSIEWRRVNLIDMREVADALEVIGAAEAPAHVTAVHLLERMGHHGRANALRVLRQAARHHGTVVAVVDTEPAPDVTFRDPTTWHLELEQLERELDALGLVHTSTPLHETERDTLRKTHLVEISIVPENGAS